MTLFEWTSDYELDIPQIDDQHKELVKMINDLYASIKSRHSGDVVNATLNNLLQYVDIHFETEETSMQSRNYPGLDDHIQLHNELRTKVLELKKEQLQGENIASFELMNFLVDWLKNHISNIDRTYGEYLHKLGRQGLG